MQEDLKKKFILLSNIAKEKKYAQEYLGLLARRGDIGSIRIGKRWYTKREWFLEFLADAEAKKAKMKTPKSLMATGQAVPTESEPAEAKIAEKVKIEKVFSPRAVEFVPRDLPDRIELNQKIEIKRENVQVGRRESASELKSEAGWESFYAQKEETVREEKKEAVPIEKIVPKKIFLRIERKLPVIDPVRNKFCDPLRLTGNKENLCNRIRYSANISNGVDLKKNANQGNRADWENLKSPFLPSSSAEREGSWQASRKKEKSKDNLKIWSAAGSASPSFLPEQKERLALFPKLAFSMAVVLLLVFIFQFGLVFKSDIKRLAGIESGTVAGASDSKVDLLAVKNSSLGYLENQEGEIKENISLGRVLVRAAMERENVEGN